jgi:uncharacterized protein YrrD
MNLHIKQLYGSKLGARDGEIGHVKDVYFDERRWVVRYLVADTGSWLPLRQVLLSPRVLGQLNQQTNILHVNLSRQRIENCPPIDSHRPVSRQYEAEYYRYYGWPVYWIGDGFGGLGGFPGIIPVQKDAASDHDENRARDDVHLHSTKAVTGYQVHALDGTVGHISDFVVDDDTWAIREIVVQTGHWYASKHVRIAPRDIERLSYEQSTVFVLLSQDDIEGACENAMVTARNYNRKAFGLEE